jgi:hypothetical protein
LPAQGLQARFVYVERPDEPAALGEQLRGRAADARGGAGDEDGARAFG